MTPTPEALAQARKVMAVKSAAWGHYPGLYMEVVQACALALTEQARAVERATWEAAAAHVDQCYSPGPDWTSLLSQEFRVFAESKR